MIRDCMDPIRDFRSNGQSLSCDPVIVPTPGKQRSDSLAISDHIAVGSNSPRPEDNWGITVVQILGVLAIHMVIKRL